MRWRRDCVRQGSLSIQRRRGSDSGGALMLTMAVHTATGRPATVFSGAQFTMGSVAWMSLQVDLDRVRVQGLHPAAQHAPS
eukprot:1797006-Rhodomonas_salina.1